MTAAKRGEHPPWCTRRGCADRGGHMSRRVTAGRAGSDVPVTVYAVQLIVAGAEPHLALQIDGDDQVLLGLPQSRVLAWLLQRLLRTVAHR